MRTTFVLVAVLGLLCALAAQTSAAKVPPGPIKHFIVLMMENRAFDHMLGWMHEKNPEIIGLNGTQSNPWDLNDPNGIRIFANKRAKDVAPDFSHSINGTSMQIYGSFTPNPWASPDMQGFVQSGRLHDGVGDEGAPETMAAWTPERVPVISTLASQFALFDEYHASVPGPTDVNRLFFHSATSYGDGVNNVFRIIGGYPQRTLYELLDEADYNWRSYYGEVPDLLFFKYARDKRFWDRFHLLEKFYIDLVNGDLPTFTFISPSYFGIGDYLANDQHPDHAVSAGEMLLKRVYEAIRNSPVWDQSALLVTYDEHGGFYDHVAPPSEGIPNPDGRMSTYPPFTFERLGIRVPTIVVSPWVNPGVHHAPTHNKPTPTSAYEHTSLIATLTRMWGLNGPLNRRDAWAAPWDFIFSERTTPRSDCPTTLPSINMESHAAYLSLKAKLPENLQPLNELQTELIQMGNAVAGLHPHANLDVLKTEEEGGLYLRNLVLNFIEENRQLAQGTVSISGS